MIVVGLTGSIAMGKTETARLFRAAGVPVFDADECVASLYASGGEAVAPLKRLFPQAVQGDSVDRSALSSLLVENPDRLSELEAVVHPLVRQAESRFIAECRAKGEPLIVLDIPLLFETGRAQDVDLIVVVTAPPEVQRSRALARKGMTREKLDMILSRQYPDAEKRDRADYVIDTSRGLEAAARDVGRIIQDLRKREGESHAGSRSRH